MALNNDQKLALKKLTVGVATDLTKEWISANKITSPEKIVHGFNVIEAGLMDNIGSVMPDGKLSVVTGPLPKNAH